ncbi:MAG: hypothetical protein ABII12_12290 [Planctomycetota bacterium]
MMAEQRSSDGLTVTTDLMSDAWQRRIAAQHDPAETHRETKSQPRLEDNESPMCLMTQAVA